MKPLVISLFKYLSNIGRDSESKLTTPEKTLSWSPSIGKLWWTQKRTHWRMERIAVLFCTTLRLWLTISSSVNFLVRITGGQLSKRRDIEWSTCRLDWPCLMQDSLIRTIDWNPVVHLLVWSTSYRRQGKQNNMSRQPANHGQVSYEDTWKLLVYTLELLYPLWEIFNCGVGRPFALYRMRSASVMDSRLRRISSMMLESSWGDFVGDWRVFISQGFQLFCTAVIHLPHSALFH